MIKKILRFKMKVWHEYYYSITNTFKMENLLANKDLINKYLRLVIKQQFNTEIDLRGEYTFTENLVSKKPIIATTFSEKILSQPDIKMVLTSVITEINIGVCTTEQMQKAVEIYPETDSREMQEIV
ncbi:MAG TPA: hypothetical protein DIW37_15185 [Chryseobacterium sp.]|nr:hypothetical protein [Chryseobacterium sp.]